MRSLRENLKLRPRFEIFPLSNERSRLLSCLLHGVQPEKTKDLFRQKSSIYIRRCAFTYSLIYRFKPTLQLCNQWTRPLYHLFRQETHLFSGEMIRKALKKYFSTVVSQRDERSLSDSQSETSTGVHTEETENTCGSWWKKMQMLRGKTQENLSNSPWRFCVQILWLICLLQTWLETGIPPTPNYPRIRKSGFLETLWWSHTPNTWENTKKSQPTW